MQSAFSEQIFFLPCSPLLHSQISSLFSSSATLEGRVQHYRGKSWKEHIQPKILAG